MAHEAGKGDKARQQRDDAAYQDGWERIFGKKQREPEVPKELQPWTKPTIELTPEEYKAIQEAFLRSIEKEGE